MVRTQHDIALDRTRSGQPVLIEPWNVQVPDPAVLQFADGGGGHPVVATMRRRESVLPELVALEVSVLDAEKPISSGTLRDVKVAEINRFALRFLKTGSHDGYLNASLVELTAAEIQPSVRGGNKWADSDYWPDLVFTNSGMTAAPEWIAELRAEGPSSERATRVVAAIYRLGMETDETPNAFVARILGLRPSTASHWIKLARRAGTLDPTTRKPRRGASDA